MRRTAVGAAGALLLVCGCGPRVDEPVWTGTSPAGLHYRVEGRGPTVVLIPAFSMDLRMWDAQVPALAERYRVVRYDLRGHGQSAGIGGAYAAREDLRDVLDAVGAGEAMLVGLSAGAQIAVDFALSYPARVTRLVLASPGLSGYAARDAFDWMGPVLEASRAGDAEMAAGRWADTRMMAIPTNPAADSLMRRLTQDNARIWLATRNPERPLDPPAIGRLWEIGVPVLIVVGERDLADIHRVGDTLHACIGGAGKRVIAGASHMVNLTAPAEFTALLLEFLSQRGVLDARVGSRCRARA